MEGFQISGAAASTFTGEAMEKLPGAMEGLDRGLDRLDEALAHLEQRLGPALTQYAELAAAQTSPKPEPSSQIRGRVERFHDLVSRLEQITSRVEL